jgi:hypothetical protein
MVTGSEFRATGLHVSGDIVQVTWTSGLGFGVVTVERLPNGRLLVDGEGLSVESILRVLASAVTQGHAEGLPSL